MFPLDLILLTKLVQWIIKKTYYSFTTSRYLPIEKLVDISNSTLLNDVYFTGTITEIEEDVAYIDGRYTFSVSNISRDVYVGDIVTCIINSDKCGLFSDITVIDILKDSEEPLEAASNSSKAHGVIVKRDNRTFTVSPGPLEFNLDDVSSKFIPEVGDVVELCITKSEDDREQIINIYPQGYKVITGTISSFDNEGGFINDVVVFQKYHCQPGYLPVKGDRVVLSIIRCQNGSTRFRALHVSPLINYQTSKGLSQSLISCQQSIGDITFCPREVICLKLNEPKLVDAELVNNSNTEYKLLKLKAYTSESLIELVEPVDIVSYVKPKSKLCLKFKITIKYCGFSSVTFDFIFENFIFNGSLHLLAINDANDFIMSQLDLKKSETSVNVKKDKTFICESRSYYLNKAPLPGRHFRRPIKFYPVKLRAFEIPVQITDIFKEREKGELIKNELETYLPSLQTGLRSENYKVYLHCLLYLEEIAGLDKISKLELISGFEIKNDFLILCIEEESNYSLLQPGDRVFARKPWETDGDIFEGIIWHVQSKEIHIKFGCAFHNNYIPRSEYVLTFVCSRFQLKLKHQAIDDTMNNLGIKWLFPNQVNLSPPLIIQVSDESEECEPKTDTIVKRNTQWNNMGTGYGDSQKMHFLRNIVTPNRKKVIKWFNVDLNYEQKVAVINALRAELRPFPYVVFGPPGTGKTITLVEICLQIYHLIPESRLLIVAPSNSAADLLSLSLLASGFIDEFDFIRLASYHYITGGNVPDGLSKYVYVANFKEQPEPGDVPSVNRNILSEKKIVISTMGNAGVLRVMGFPFGYYTHIIVDEAGQVTEPENLIVASLMNKETQIILAGDPLQLGPVVLSKFAKSYGLGQSFLQRIMGFKPYIPDQIGFPDSYGYNPKFITKLVRSYRTVPTILNLISHLFYRDELKPMIDGSTSKEALLYLKIKEIFPPDSEIPIIFHSISGRESSEEGSFSLYNNEEVFQICTYLSQLYRLGIRSDDIGIITPYMAQVKKIIQFLNSLSQEVPKIGSVEEFQGQERDFILLSTVRSSLISDKNVNQLSFIYSPQRINVAISRAKSVLIIVGNTMTLCNDKIWNNIVQYAIDHKSFRR